MMEEKKATLLKPLFLVKPGTVSQKDIRRAERLTGIVFVECSEPDSARYMEPPLHVGIDAQSRAALSLVRIIMKHPNADLNRGAITKWFVELLMDGEVPTPVEKVKGK